MELEIQQLVTNHFRFNNLQLILLVYLALKIRKADVLGYSLGSFVAQEIAITHPDKVNRLILVAASCGGQESILQNPEVVTMSRDFLNKIVNNISITPMTAVRSSSQHAGQLPSIYPV